MIGGLQTQAAGSAWSRRVSAETPPPLAVMNRPGRQPSPWTRCRPWSADSALADLQRRIDVGGLHGRLLGGLLREIGLDGQGSQHQRQQ